MASVNSFIEAAAAAAMDTADGVVGLRIRSPVLDIDAATLALLTMLLVEVTRAAAAAEETLALSWCGGRGPPSRLAGFAAAPAPTPAPPLLTPPLRPGVVPVDPVGEVRGELPSWAPPVRRWCWRELSAEGVSRRRPLPLSTESAIAGLRAEAPLAPPPMRAPLMQARALAGDGVGVADMPMPESRRPRRASLAVAPGMTPAPTQPASVRAQVGPAATLESMKGEGP